MKAKVPQVKTHPILLTLESYLKPFAKLEELSQEYGEIFETKVAGLPPTIILSHPDHVRTVLMGGYAQFDSGPTNNLLKPFLGANSLLLLDGEQHQQRKKLVNPPFARDAVQKYGQTIAEVTARTLAKWQPGSPVRVCHSMRDLALEVVLRLIWDLEPEELAELQEAIGDWLSLFAS